MESIGFAGLSLYFIGFARYVCPVQRVTNRLQMGYEWVTDLGWDL